jgi:hypothetical protein
MKIKINWNGRDTTFYGLKKFQLHSMNTDRSQLRSVLGIGFQKNGVLWLHGLFMYF